MMATAIADFCQAIQKWVEGVIQAARLICRSWLASELGLEDSGAAIAGKPAPTGGAGRL